ncbi:glycosyltransferase WbuB, partial [Acinetobacter baumannii]
YHPYQNTTGYLLGKLYDTLNVQSDIDLVLIAKEDMNCPQHANAHFIKAKKPNKASLFKRFLYELIIAFSFLMKTLK